MANTLSGSQKSLKDQDRRAFLRRRGYADLPSLAEDVSEAQSAVLRALARSMQVRGLYAKTSAGADIRQSIRRLVGELRAGA